MSKSKVLVIVGPTASGKTSLSIKLAKKFNGEILSADSRQVYKGLDIGTGKVTKDEMSGIQHHLLDVADPQAQYSVAEFAKDGEEALHKILSRKKLPIIAGGTFFYVDVLLGRIIAPEVPPNEALRLTLEEKSNDELVEILKQKDSGRVESIDTKNPRRIIRAIEIAEALGSVPAIQPEEAYDVLTIGIDISKESLQKNIHARLESRLQHGLMNEVNDLLDDGLSHERLSELGIEYKYLIQFLRGYIDKTEMKTQIETKSWQYAKRQLTWLKRDKTIHWIEPHDMPKAEELVRTFLET